MTQSIVDVAGEIVREQARLAAMPRCWQCGTPLIGAVEEWVGLCDTCESTTPPPAFGMPMGVERANER